MYIAFITGLAAGVPLGVLFHHWWIQPDIKDLKKELRQLRSQLKVMSAIALEKHEVRIKKNSA